MDRHGPVWPRNDVVMLTFQFKLAPMAWTCDGVDQPPVPFSPLLSGCGAREIMI